jgi:hypothetical protein
MIMQSSVENSVSTSAGKASLFRRSRLAAAIGIASLMLVAGLSGSAFAKKVCDDGGSPPCNRPDTGETGANNLSFPLILSDNASPAAFPLDGAWRWAEITDLSTQCIDENGVLSGDPVPADYVCYYGRHVTVVSETGDIVFDGDPKVWWLQKRTQNFWKTLSVGHEVTTPLVVSAVDVGDLLESSPSIQARQIRVEFNMLQNVPATDPELGQYVVTDWTAAVPSPCVVPAAAGQSLGCFAALGMSGAVPGTEQSGNEIQGTDFGPGGAVTYPGTQTLLDPTTIRAAVPADGSPAIPINALVYSNCARLVIQKIAGAPVWDETIGQWSGPGVGAPLVNIAAYTGAWTTEITSSGSIVYGYNWNAKTAATGLYRLTMVLDGNDAEGPVCSSTLATEFESGSTKLVNQGENNLSTVIYAGDSDLGDEGGLVYIDLELTTKGGGGGGGKPGGTPGGGKP